jgi:co-chaperonin GroES (HSP10)
MALIAHPVGPRVKIKILPNESKTKAGIHLPDITFGEKLARATAPQGNPDKPEAGSGAMLTSLQLARVLEVGEGRFNPENGTYRGSRYKENDLVYIRVGPSAQVHMDITPEDAKILLVLEDLIVARVEGEIEDEAAADAKTDALLKDAMKEPEPPGPEIRPATAAETKKVLVSG